MNKDNTDYDNTEQLEAHSKSIVALLDVRAQRLDMRTLTQLENGRARAVAMHQERDGSAVNADGTLSHWMGWVEHHRVLFAGLVMIVLISSFVALQTFNTNETSDAFLLGADLPPEAFVDKGFEPSLNKHANI